MRAVRSLDLVRPSEYDGGPVFDEGWREEEETKE